MMRRSGVSPLVYFSKLAREMLRLAASGHRPSTQDSKFAAAARIALACISGWPDEPDSPLHSFGGAGAAERRRAEPAPARHGRRRARAGRPASAAACRSGCAKPRPAAPSSNSAAKRHLQNADRMRSTRRHVFMSSASCRCPIIRPLLGQDMVERALTAQFTGARRAGSAAGATGRPAAARSVPGSDRHPPAGRP